MTPRLLSLLQCPDCGSEFDALRATGEAASFIVCKDNSHRVPIVNDIARFRQLANTDEGRRTQASFGYEWTHFNDPRPSGELNVSDYFDGFSLPSLAGLRVLDAGCGMGRHAMHVARFAAHVVAVDFSSAIEQAKRNTAAAANIDCIQADVLALPLRNGVFDFVYSLGVLHHLSETKRALDGLVSKVKPGGRVRVYLYWKRHGWQGALLRVITLMRRLTTRLPFSVLRVCCWFLSVALYAAIILPYRALARFGFDGHSTWPLFVYTRYPFYVLYNDQFDRFSAPIEKRYDPPEVKALLESAGLAEVTVRPCPCFGWLGDGIKPL